MHILVINSGSSSIKFSIFRSGEGESLSLFTGEASALETDGATLRFADANGADRTGGRVLGAHADAADAIAVIAELVTQQGLPQIEATGFRIVHTGPRITAHGRITPAMMDDLRCASEFAPLHEPGSIRMIEEMQRRLPAVPQYACFDTIFHETMPEEAKIYALPKAVRERGVRRYGFHGLSCESVVAQLREAELRGELRFPSRAAVAHLGSGCSVTAMLDGRSVDTTMGLTPDGGVVMGTRPGDLDPGVVLYLLRQQRGDRETSISAVEGLLNREAGTHAISGLPNDNRRVREAAAAGDAQATLALRVFTRSVTKAIGGFAALLGGLDAVVFTGGIGEHDGATRREVLQGMEAFGVRVDDERNEAKGEGLRRLSADGAATAVYVMTAEEDRMIAQHVRRMSAEDAE